MNQILVSKRDTDKDMMLINIMILICIAMFSIKKLLKQLNNIISVYLSVDL